MTVECRWHVLVLGAGLCVLLTPRCDLRHLVRVSVLLHDLVQRRVAKAAYLGGSEALLMVVSHSRWWTVKCLLY